MGIAGFLWERNQMVLLMNRDNWDTRVIKKVEWVGTTLRGACEKTGGTWFGLTRSGRVAFLMDSALMNEEVDENERCPEKLPMEFLESDLSPEMFAVRLVQEEEDFHFENDAKMPAEGGEILADDAKMPGRAYELIVVHNDTDCRSMVYISKPSKDESRVDFKLVPFGVHTLSVQGLNSDSPRDQRLKNKFIEIITEYDPKKEKPSHLAEKFMYDPTEAVPGDVMTGLFVDRIEQVRSSPKLITSKRYGTTSTTAMVVDNKFEIDFYEMYFSVDRENSEKWYTYTF